MPAMMRLLVATAILLLVGGTGAIAQSNQPSSTVTPARMPVIATVDDRYQSYNIELVEVMGGTWWAPYSQQPSVPAASSGGFNAAMRYQAPIDLRNPKLRKLAAALSPAYVRVSDAWANTMYFLDTAASQPAPLRLALAPCARGRNGRV